MKTTPLALAVTAVATLALAACGNQQPQATVTVQTPVASPTTVTASPTADPSAGASRTGVAPVGTAVPDATMALTEKYCTKAQKVCFNYPAGYKVSTEPVQAAGVTGEKGTVTDPLGTVVLGFNDGISGIGGMCEKPAAVPNMVQAVYDSKVTGLTPRSNEGQAAAVISQVAVYNADTSKFTAQTFLTNSVKYSKMGSVSDCGVMFGDVIAAGTGGSFHVGDLAWQDKARKEYASADEAKQAYVTPQSKMTVEILKTVTVG